MLLRLGGVAVVVALVGGIVLLRGGNRAAAGTSFQILSPSAGATVASPVLIDVGLQGAQLGVPSTGLDHLHVSIDGGQPIALYHAPELTVPLAPGEHTVAVQLADAAHDGILPPQTVTFSVGG
ncbi:MAG: hypothetical protein KGK07_17030 [Chloroflexota bacterium]|nr:hypothetical protein [Chloroflexota bacterium]